MRDRLAHRYFDTSHAILQATWTAICPSSRPRSSTSSPSSTTAERPTAALDRVLELTVLLADDMNASFERDGLTPARAHLLWVLQQRGPSTQRLLADTLRVSARNITGLVDGLESSGLVVRRPHPTDRRATLVAFTDEGGRIAGEVARGQKELATGLFGPLYERELDRFTSTLGQVLERLKAMIAQAGAGATAKEGH